MSHIEGSHRSSAGRLGSLLPAHPSNAGDAPDGVGHDAAPETSLRVHLERKNRELSRRNRELQAFEEIASTMQTTMDIGEVQERVVVGLTKRLGFRRAVFGLCDPGERSVTDWLAAIENGTPTAAGDLPILDPEETSGAVIAALRGDHIAVMSITDVATDVDRSVLQFFGPSSTPRVAVVPVRCRGHLVGSGATVRESGRC